MLVDIGPMVDGWRAAVGDRDPHAPRIGNVAARCWMVALWDLAAKHHEVVIGTENRTESLLGYFTVYGDAGSAVEPIAGLYKGRVWALSDHLGVPRRVVERPPTADLWAGQTDESELGMRYAEADRVLHWAVDRGLSPEATIERTGLPVGAVAHDLARHHATAFKRELPFRFIEQDADT